MSATAISEPESDPLVGATLQQRYVVTRLIGKGGMGAVYEAKHLAIGNTVAIKVLHPKFAKEPAIVARFRREAQATTHIRHHNIVGMFDLGELDDGSLYLAMEHLDGRDWSKDIETDGPQPLAKVIHIASQVCDALAAAHESGIVHRDIKPENIYLVRRSGDGHFVKVVDFGISKVNSPDAELAPSLTKTGAALGTPYYMAPEQVHGRKDIDARTDVYALGVVLFQALTGRFPFDGETYPMLVMNIVAQPLPQLSAYRPDLPRELQGVLERMVAKDRADRFPTADAVKAALRPFADFVDQPGAAIAVTPAPASSTPSHVQLRAGEHAAPARGRVPLLLGVLVALLLLGALLGTALAIWSGAPESTGTTGHPPETTPSQTSTPARTVEAPVEPRIDPVDPPTLDESPAERADPAPAPAEVRGTDELASDLPADVPARVEPSHPSRRPRRPPIEPIVREAPITVVPGPNVGSNDAPILH